MVPVDHPDETVLDGNVHAPAAGRDHARGADPGDQLTVGNVEIRDQPRRYGPAAGLDPAGPVQQRDAMTGPRQLLRGRGPGRPAPDDDGIKHVSFSRHKRRCAAALHGNHPERHDTGPREKRRLGGEDRCESRGIGGHGQPRDIDGRRPGKTAETGRDGLHRAPEAHPGAFALAAIPTVSMPRKTPPFCARESCLDSPGLKPKTRPA